MVPGRMRAPLAVLLKGCNGSYLSEKLEFSETPISMLGVTRRRRYATSRPRPRNVPLVYLPTRPLFWLSRSGCRRGWLIGRAKAGRQLLKHAGRREVLTAL